MPDKMGSPKGCPTASSDQFLRWSKIRPTNFGSIMATNAEPIQNGLYLVNKTETREDHTKARCPTARGPRPYSVHRSGNNVLLLFVASQAGDSLAGHCGVP